MARKRPIDDRSSKMTVMIFQLEGDDATLQEGFKTIATALSKVLPASHTVALPSTPGSVELSQNIFESDDSPETIDVEPASKSRRVSSGSRSIKSPQILDIDLNSGTPSLNEFLTRHTVTEITKRYLLIAYWLKTQRELEEVCMDHIHTCFRHMGWQTPKQAAQPLRDMKSRLGWFHKGDEKGFYKINHVGENEVLKILEGRA